jgi:hypothetical protein
MDLARMEGYWRRFHELGSSARPKAVYDLY